MPNAKPAVSLTDHTENLKRWHTLEKKGYQIKCNAQAYQVWAPGGIYAGGASSMKPPHGRYREANFRDNLRSALSTAANHERKIQNMEPEVAKLHGICYRRGGHTEEDATHDLKILSPWCGLQLVALWDFQDWWGAGGNSQYAVVKPGKDGLHEAPGEIFNHLWGEEEEPNPQALQGLKPGRFIKGSKKFNQIDTHNWAKETAKEETQ
jgi:hypothetical protein